MKRLAIILLLLFIPSIAIAGVQNVRVLPMTYSMVASTTTVAATATAIPATPLVNRTTIAITLADTADTVYIGHSGVTTGTGFILDSSRPSITIDVDDSVVVYGIVASGTAGVRCLEAK